MKTIGVCGAGTMGRGIAQLCSAAGFVTILYDLDGGALEKSRSQLLKDLQQLVDRNRMELELKQSILRNLIFTSTLEDCVVDLAIEAIVEQEETKIVLFNQLAEINDRETIFASNTSSLSISKIGDRTAFADRVAGLHFFNPAPIMKLVEIVRGKATSDDVIMTLVDFARRLGKHPVVCLDSPGFIVNRVARPYYLESLRLVEQGITDFATIDSLLEDKGFKMGPFKLMDLIGNDVNYSVSCSVYDQLNKPERLKPSYIQKQKVDNRELGKKTGKGYYEY